MHPSFGKKIDKKKTIISESSGRKKPENWLEGSQKGRKTWAKGRARKTIIVSNEQKKKKGKKKNERKNERKKERKILHGGRPSMEGNSDVNFLVSLSSISPKPFPSPFFSPFFKEKKEHIDL
jgi:hypothetical protein